MVKMSSALFLVLLTAITVPSAVSGGKVLFWMPFISKSVQITYIPLAEELGRRGHEVTIVTAWPTGTKEEDSNIREILVDVDIANTIANVTNAFLEGNQTPLKRLVGGPSLLAKSLEANDRALEHPDIKKLIKDPKTKFDVVVVSALIANEAGYYLAHRFGRARLCLYLTVQRSMPTMDHAMGMPHNPALLPFFALPFAAPREMDLHQRIASTVATLFFEHIIRNQIILRKVNKLLDKHFPGEQRPDLLELERNTSLALHFGHHALMDGLRPLAPNFVYVGMMNCRVRSKATSKVFKLRHSFSFQKPEPLPGDFQEYIDGAKNGVIYMSLGSAIQSSHMSEERRTTFLNVFRRLKQRVIWKWETETMPDLPSNVKLSKWLPQPGILAHPNVRLFLSHGGQSSTQETICHTTPAVVLPLALDQQANAREVERLGIGAVIPFHEVTEENLAEVVDRMLGDPGYTKRMEEHSALLLDQIDKPLDRAVWWLEHVMRHPDIMDYLRPPVHDLYWFQVNSSVSVIFNVLKSNFSQFYLLDVFAFLVGIFLTLAYLVKKVIVFICCRSRKTSMESEVQTARKRKTD